jgi:hypothetical protein
VFASAALTDGFGLIGAEVHPDADQERVEAVLAQLVKDGSAALVLLESRLSQPAGPWLTPPAQRRRADRRHRVAALAGTARLCAGGRRGGACSVGAGGAGMMTEACPSRAGNHSAMPEETCRGQR